MSSYSDFANAAGRIEQQKGAALADAASRNGQLYGSALANLGQLIVNAPIRHAQQQRLEQEQQLGALDLQQRRRAMKAQDLLGQGIAKSIRPDGSVDLTDFAEQARTNPEIAAVWPTLMEHINKAAETTLSLRKTKAALAQQEADQIGEFVAAAKSAPTPSDQAAVFAKLLQHGVAAGTIDGDHARDTLAQLVGPDGTPDPQAVSAFFTRAEQLTSQARVARAKAAEPYTLKPQEKRIVNGQVVAEGGPKPITDKTELMLAATDPANPNYEHAKAALALEQTSAPKETEAAMDAKYQDIVAKQLGGQVITPEEKAYKGAYEKRKTLVPAAVNVMNTPQRNDARADRSYTAQTARIDKVRTPIAQQLDRLSRLQDTINQKTPQADALVAPELLTVMAGGQGSGLRMNEAEISRIVGGRSHFESLKAALNKWQTDPSKALSITDAQRAQIRSLMVQVQARSRAKLAQLNKAENDLIEAPDVESQRRIANQALQGLEDAAEPMSVSSGGEWVDLGGGVRVRKK